jgi:PIN domain nuclease of toxin-antitoxin system
LDNDVCQILENSENIIYVSSESIKEAIHLFHTQRVKTNKWKVSRDIFNFIEKELGFVIKYVQKEHLITFASLDLVKDRNDPTDRLIISQAISEKIPLISSDRKFEHYRKQNLLFIYNRK